MSILPPKRLGDFLVEEKVISKNLLEQAILNQKQTGKRIGEFLVDLGYVSPIAIAKAVGKQSQMPYMDLTTFKLDIDLGSIFPEPFMREHCFIPIESTGPILRVAITDPAQKGPIDQFCKGKNLEPRFNIALEADVKSIIEAFFRKGQESQLEEAIKNMEEGTLEVIEESMENDQIESDEVETAPIIKLVNLIVTEAINVGASDIHIEPKRNNIHLRYRIDGVLQPQKSMPKNYRNPLVARIKIISTLDISERRLPQDGRFRVHHEGKLIDCRVSTMPSKYGEKVVIRLLDQSNLVSKMGDLGMEPEVLEQFTAAIHEPFGMVLVTGPTGSGKTTTLYTALQDVATPHNNVISIEDPIEYDMETITQVQVNQQIGLDFSTVLRAILRQDPDVVMIGEIRDLETIEIAIKAALTGHLVLSTLHTNNASSTISRLLDMGVPPYLVTASVKMIIAQRLVRRICLNCKIGYKPDPALLKKLEINDGKDYTFFKGEGCPSCLGTGYKGRVALIEGLRITDGLKTEIIKGTTSSHKLEEIALKEGMQSLRRSGTEKIKEGITTVEEVMTATSN